MKILHLLHVTAARWFYRWAMKEICPPHPDVPRIIMRCSELDDKARRLWA